MSGPGRRGGAELGRARGDPGAVIAGDEDLAALHATRHVLKAGQRYAAAAQARP